MRVIAGVHRGRRLLGPSGQAIRPTSDRVKEALFSILGERTTGARVLDLYAGTGSIGSEALSRGAAHVTFVEADRTALRLVQSNLQHCGLEPSASICACQVSQFFRRTIQFIVDCFEALTEDDTAAERRAHEARLAQQRWHEFLSR